MKPKIMLFAVICLGAVFGPAEAEQGMTAGSGLNDSDRPDALTPTFPIVRAAPEDDLGGLSYLFAPVMFQPPDTAPGPMPPAAPGNPPPADDQLARWTDEPSGQRRSSRRGPASLTPHMIGDFGGYFSTSTITVTTSVSDAIVPNFASVTDRFTITVPVLSRGGFKIAEDESPEPQDRVYVSYNYYRHIPTMSQGGSSSLTLNPAANNFSFAGPGPFPLRQDLTATLIGAQLEALFGIPNLPLIHFAQLQVRPVDVNRETIGLEKTFSDGEVSLGLRIPLIQANQSTSVVPNSNAIANFQDGFPTTGNIVGVSNTSDRSQLGDLSFVFKYALINNRDTGSVLSTGLVLTVPTGGGIPLPDGQRLYDAIIQPYAGYRLAWDRLYVHGFSSLAVPTDSRDVMLLFNDVGVGYELYRRPDSGLLRSVAPTFEAHLTTPLDGFGTTQLSTPDVLALTSGVHFGVGAGGLLTVGVTTPVTGPRPYEVEGIVQFGWRF